MRIFGIDPGSERTGYGCVESVGSRQRIVSSGAISSPAGASFPEKLLRIHHQLSVVLAECAPDCVAIENLFHAVNVRSALKLGHARGVAMLAAVEAGLPVVEYTPAEIKRAVVGYGRAEKHQVQQMVKLILGLAVLPTPHDAADALAVAICHINSLRAGACGGRFAAAGREGSGQLAAVPVRHDRDRVPARTDSRQAAEPDCRRRERGGLRPVRPALDLLWPLGGRRRSGAARAHARPGRRVVALRVRDEAGAGSVRAADRGQRHRAQGGPRGPLGDRTTRSDSCDRARRPGAVDGDSRRRQEDLGADRRWN